MSKYAKAILAAVIAGLGSLATALVDDKGFGDLTDGQWVVAVIATLTALAAVFAVPNQPATPPAP